MNRSCIGYGEFEGKCNNIAGTKWSPHWCEKCNKLRLDHIDKSMNKLMADMKSRPAQWGE